MPHNIRIQRLPKAVRWNEGLGRVVNGNVNNKTSSTIAHYAANKACHEQHDKCDC